MGLYLISYKQEAKRQLAESLESAQQHLDMALQGLDEARMHCDTLCNEDENSMGERRNGEMGNRYRGMNNRSMGERLPRGLYYYPMGYRGGPDYRGW